jgi:hypothetical protein
MGLLAGKQVKKKKRGGEARSFICIKINAID